MTIPSSEVEALPEPPFPVEPPGVDQISSHTEIQWLLAKLGSDMGLEVWVAKNDQSKSFAGKDFKGIKHYRAELSFNFEDAVNRTIEMIDVIWLKGNSILAAFEIESTTSIYSGLLRMADLISMLPNLKIPLFIVAPDERRKKVFEEVNRPTFAHLPTPMADTCRYIAFSTLRERTAQLALYAKYLKPEILDEMAELCEFEDA